MSAWLIVLLSVAALLLAGAYWWWRASRRRCPLDGGVRCRHCVYDEEEE